METFPNYPNCSTHTHANYLASIFSDIAEAANSGQTGAIEITQGSSMAEAAHWETGEHMALPIRAATTGYCKLMPHKDTSSNGAGVSDV